MRKAQHFWSVNFNISELLQHFSSCPLRSGLMLNFRAKYKKLSCRRKAVRLYLSVGFSFNSTNYLHFTASEISADDITAPISPHRTSPPAKFTAFALHRRQITPLCKSPPWRILRLATHRRTVKCARITPSGLAWDNHLYPQLVMGATNTTRTHTWPVKVGQKLV